MFCAFKFCVLVLFFAWFPEHTFGELNITLWQFGTDRLLHHGGFTEPLRPIGVASDDLSTTYIYEVLYPTTTAHGSLGTTLSTLRTIIASASGWVELFDSGNMECKFVNSDSGKCSDEKFTGTGVPSPVILPVLASPTSTPAEPVNSDWHQSSPHSTTSRSSQVGAIVGGTIAALVSVCNIVILILWLRKRRQRSSPGQGLTFDDCDTTTQERKKRSRRQELLVEPFNSHLEDIHLPAGNMGSDNPYLDPVLSTQNAISTRTENGTPSKPMQPRSKRAKAPSLFARGNQTLSPQVTVAVEQLIMRRSEGLSSASDPPPPYTTG
ncbi:hypothetical protein BDP27DRAFT_1370312 [Rhodocollybia butyracea]|uniref:Mid2 domain-containing protein n=1 Tax=Rhodocollybia butyracea TaxID=206335 RepID=A0A9P5PDG4_9AGAR|nr:hypothetical protein BDP27DRAFT_1370312 [Rhodocollybia butyracea]